MFNIKEELKKLPNKPGVYIMKDEHGEIIYIGKAIILKNRVRQYFQSSKNHSPKVIAMVQNIREFEYIITDSELEALILECNLIKRHRPKYNILLKDDKNYPYIKVLTNEEFPRIMVTRKILKDGAKYFGPYSSSFSVNDTIEAIKKVFPLRTCNKKFPMDIGKGRPCLNFHIKKCIGPCTGEVSTETYNEMIKEIILFLDGKHDLLIGKLQDKMNQYSENLDFEQAAIIRDKLESIKHISQKQKIISTALKDQDVIAFARDEKDAVVQVFFIRGGKLLGREKFVLDGTEFNSRSDILHEFIKQFYLITDYIPREILLQEEIDEINIIQSWLTSKRGSKVYLRVPKKGENSELVDMVYKNAFDALRSIDDDISRKNDKIDVLNELMELLNLTEIPHRIEAYDISNINGSLSVGSMVTFIDGKPNKGKYRRFKIKTVKGPNDYLSMQEILFRRLSNEKDYSGLPDLICIDGGKGHVNAALEIIKEKGLNIQICGLVKDDKYKTRGIIYNNTEYNLKQHPKLFKFLESVQDEVHRFAITYHKLLREKQIKNSALDEIDGIGEKRKMALLKHFKSIDNIKNATLKEICNVKGMNEKAAKNVYNYFGGEGSEV